MPPRNPVSKKSSSRMPVGSTLIPPDPSGRGWKQEPPTTESTYQTQQEFDVYQQLTNINSVLQESLLSKDNINQKVDDVVLLCKENVAATTEIARKMNDPDNGIYKRLADAKAEAVAARTEVQELETQSKQSETKTQTSFEKVEGSLSEMKTSLMKLDMNLQEIMKWRDSAQNAFKWTIALVISTIFGIFVKHAWDITVPQPGRSLQPPQVTAAQAYTPPPVSPPPTSSAQGDIYSIK